MQEYIDNGALLGWLINPQDNQVEIYRKGQVVELLENPTELSGEDVLPDFLRIECSTPELHRQALKYNSKSKKYLYAITQTTQTLR
jgi:Uma2 family endonuclease